MFLPDNTPAPAFSFEAVGSGRPVTLQSTSGSILLVFHSYQTSASVATVIRTVREVYPRPNEVLVVGVADLRPVPRLLRGVVRGFIEDAYKDASKQIPDGQNPADHVIILADWNGALYKAYKVPLTNRQLALIAINNAKEIAGNYFGAQPAQAALSLLANIRPPNKA